MFLIRAAFLALLLVAGPSLAAPPPGKVARIGYLSNSGVRLAEMKTALAERGYVEGKNVLYESRLGDLAQLDDLAVEVVASRPDVIFGITTPMVAALQRATRTIPIVMMYVSDPVGSGFAQTLARPGGNITGASDLQDATLGKLLELSLALAPGRRVGVLTAPENPRHAPEVALLQAAARKSRSAVTAYPSLNTDHLDATFSAAARDGVRVMIVLGGAPFDTKSKLVLDAASRNRIGTAHIRARYVTNGGLFSYGLEHKTYVQDVAAAIDRVINGGQPAVMPITQPTQFELTINPRTAQQLGLAIAPELSITAVMIE
jgi:putative ABC transport system substrate-binding protein